MVCQKRKTTQVICTKKPKRTPTTIPSDRKPRILVVEDAKTSQDAATTILRELLCDIDVAADGNQALELVEKQPYDLILMDIGLPDMDGMTVSETIRFLEKKSHVPIVALTVFEEKDVKNSCIKCGMNQFLEKPLTIEKAKQMLEKFKLLTT